MLSSIIKIMSLSEVTLDRFSCPFFMIKDRGFLSPEFFSCDANALHEQHLPRLLHVTPVGLKR